MDFSLSQDQEIFRGFVHKYLKDMEKTLIAREYIDNKLEKVKEILDGLNELGCMQLNIPEQYGGMGLGILDLVSIMEELGRYVVPGLHLETSTFAVPVLETFGSDEQKATYLSKVAEEKACFTIAWQEPGRSFKKQGIQMVATIEGDKVILNGVKTQVTDVELAQYLLVPVLLNDTIIVVIVEKDIAGLTMRSQAAFDETRKASELTFSQVKVPIGNIIPAEGWTVLQEGVLSLNAALSSLMVGAIEEIVHVASEYAKIREQFGNPIGSFQAIKHSIAEMKTDLEMARSLSYYANWAAETNSEDRVEAICGAKIFTTQAFIRIAQRNIQIHGAIGITEEIDCHLYLKRARFYENYLGSLDQYYDQAIESLKWGTQKKATVSNFQ